MRRIELSGGLEIGPAGGPWIDIIGLPGQRVELGDALPAVRDYRTRWVRLKPAELSPLVRQIIPDAFAIAAWDGNLSVRFTRSRKMGDVEALRRIAAVDAIHPAMAGAIVWAVVRAKKIVKQDFDHKSRLAQNVELLRGPVEMGID